MCRDRVTVWLYGRDRDHGRLIAALLTFLLLSYHESLNVHVLERSIEMRLTYPPRAAHMIERLRCGWLIHSVLPTCLRDRDAVDTWALRCSRGASCLKDWPAYAYCHADLDECHAGVHTCSPNAVCNNTLGAFTCQCNSGFAGNGTHCLAGNFEPVCATSSTPQYECICRDSVTSCQDNNECKVPGAFNCNTSATCTNTVASFSCTCAFPNHLVKSRHAVYVCVHSYIPTQSISSLNILYLHCCASSVFFYLSASPAT